MPSFDPRIQIYQSMAPFEAQFSSLHVAPPAYYTKNSVIVLNVGGTVFHTSPSALKKADPGSILAGLLVDSLSAQKQEEPFFDRDPDLFAVLLSILRTSKLPSKKSHSFSIDDIASEARFFGAEGAVRSAVAPPTLDGLDMSLKEMIVPNGRDKPSALSAGNDGSLLVAHGSKISVYDWALRKQRTVLTRLNCIDTLHRVSSSIAVVGAVDFAGLDVYDLGQGGRRECIEWKILEAPEIRLHDPTVQAVASSPEKGLLFASFESSRKNANTIMLIDTESFQPVAELGRQLGGAADLEAATKLEWIGGQGLLLASSVSGGASGYRGQIKLWDIRSKNAVWEFRESSSGPSVKQQELQTDCFADVIANEELCGIFKVGVRSGSVFMADLRQLNVAEPWVCLEDLSLRPGGAQNRLLGCGRQVFCSRGADLEVWSEVSLKENRSALRRSFVGKQGGERITSMVTGGNRMFLARKDMQGIEIWESTKL